MKSGNSREKIQKDHEYGDLLQPKLRENLGILQNIDPKIRTVYDHVDEQAIASVISDWTGIPVARMMADDITNVLNLPKILENRVIGQSESLEVITKRVYTSRAKLENPNQPVGIFMLCGSSGVGKARKQLLL